MAKNGTADAKTARRAELFGELKEHNGAIDAAMSEVEAAVAARRGTVTAIAKELKLSAIEVGGEKYRIRKVKDSDPEEYDLQPVKALDFVSVDD